MRNAALTLGIIAGLIGMIVGLVSYGWTEVLANRPEAAQFFSVDNPQFIRALWGGIALIVSAALMYSAFGFNVATMFPIAMAGLGGVLALAAGKPDEPKAHF